jgi:archaemetzincin
MDLKRKGQIILVMLSEINEPLWQALRVGIETTFRRQVVDKCAIRSLAPAYDAQRDQYFSPHLLNRLRRMKKQPVDKILGVVDVDLYSPGYEFIFGEAETVSGIANLSVYRLQPDKDGDGDEPALAAERAVKEAVHELGHLYGLKHCRNRGCVMNFSVSLDRVDIKSKIFCDKCRRILKL